MQKYRNRFNRRRSFLAILLLMVMSVQMGFKTFHLHHHAAAVEFACSDCNHHRVHGGHILAWDGHADDCPLCQMLQSPYTAPDEPTAAYALVVQPTHGTTIVASMSKAAWCPTSPRAPPSFLSQRER